VSAARALPNLFVVGTAKAGTSSLYSALNRHPDVYMSPLKEPHFFADLGIEDETWLRLFNVVRTPRDYINLFAGANRQSVVGEASTSYLSNFASPARIQRVAPQARIIAILREPVQRAFSHYLNDVRHGLEKRSFSEAIQDELANPSGQRWPAHYVRYGFYSAALRRYLAAFGETRVLILFFEDMVSKPAAELEKVTDFLNISPFPEEQESLPNVNAYMQPRRVAVRFMRHPKWRLAARRVIPRPVRPLVHRVLVKDSDKPQVAVETAELLSRVYAHDRVELEGSLGLRPPWGQSGTKTDQ
jgi:hypothetical protein